MRKIKFFVIHLVLLSYTAISVQAQLKLPFSIREKYLIENYQFSKAHVNAYNKIMNDVEGLWSGIKNKKTAPENRITLEKKLSDELCRKVKAILPEAQFTMWYACHRGNLIVRVYKEDLGMTGKQFAEFRKLSDNYSKAKTEIRKNELSGTEQSELREQAFEQYASGIRQLFISSLADYLIQENLIVNSAKNLSNNYSIISESKAIRYAMLKMKYDKDREQLSVQNLKPKVMKRKKENLQEEYEVSLHSFLTNEEFVACSRKRDNLTDQRYIHTYKLSDVQLAKYKELKKKFAMKELQIKQSKIEKSAKVRKLQEAEVEFENQLGKVFGNRQFQKWKKDETTKRSKRSIKK